MSICDGVEARIAWAVVDSALAADCSVSVWEGGDWALRSSRDLAAIVAALGSTDSDVLHLRRCGKRVGTITLIYGNGVDLISDCSWTPEVEYEGSLVEAIVESAETVCRKQGLLDFPHHLDSE